MIYLLISSVLALCAWACPLIGLCHCDSSKSKNLYIPVISFAFCLLTIIFQLLLLKSYGEEWVLIIDALDALNFVIPVFAVIIVVLNVLYVRKIDKENSK